MKNRPDIKHLNNPEFFRRLNPDLAISQTPFINSQANYKFDSANKEQQLDQFSMEGYFTSNKLIDETELKALRKLVHRTHKAGLLPIFACVYDEFWQLLFKLKHTFTHLLKDDYLLTPDFWIWHISPSEAHSGWSPHRDAEIVEPFGDRSFLRADRSPKSCTIWIPLTDATPHNSCMYVIPFTKDAKAQSYLEGDSLEMVETKAANAPFNFNYIRALPAEAGSVLGWSPYVFHWGGLSSRWAESPRMSIGIYLNSQDAPIDHIPFYSKNQRFIDWHDPQFILPFKDRLRIIANIINTYKESGQLHQEENMHDCFLAFSEKILKK